MHLTLKRTLDLPLSDLGEYRGELDHIVFPLALASQSAGLDDETTGSCSAQAVWVGIATNSSDRKAFEIGRWVLWFSQDLRMTEISRVHHQNFQRMIVRSFVKYLVGEWTQASSELLERDDAYERIIYAWYSTNNRPPEKGVEHKNLAKLLDYRQKPLD